MRYAFIVENGILYVQSVTGMTGPEIEYMESFGWVTYLTTDKTARKDAEELAEESTMITAPVSTAYGVVDGDNLVIWSEYQGVNQLPRMSVQGETTLWEKVSA